MSLALLPPVASVASGPVNLSFWPDHTAFKPIPLLSVHITSEDLQAMLLLPVKLHIQPADVDELSDPFSLSRQVQAELQPPMTLSTINLTPMCNTPRKWRIYWTGAAGPSAAVIMVHVDDPVKAMRA